MLLRDEIRREALSSGEVERFKRSIRERLTDAGNETNSNRTRLESAYHAIINCALIALRVEGYRARSVQGHHRVLLESLADSLGTRTVDIDFFLDLATTRGNDIYDARPVTDGDVADAIEAATELESRLLVWLGARRV